MKLRQIVADLGLKIYNEGAHLDDEVAGGYAGDLLSDVIASGKSQDVWLTIQVHENIIAVATLKDLAAIILTKNSKPLEETLKHAEQEEVTLLGASSNTYETIERLLALGISGSR